MIFTGKSLLVLGLGRTGQATVHALEKAGAHVFTWDDANIIYNTYSEHRLKKIQDIPWQTLAAVIASPGIPFLWPHPHPVIEESRMRFVPILSDVDVLRTLAHQAKYIAITGTNGKSTTTAWLGHVLDPHQKRQDCAVGGNIGLPALDLPLWDNSKGKYVLELSSYQLEISQYPLYDISIFLNLSPDHLIRHGGMEGYITVKRRIFMNPQGVAIVGVDDAQGKDLAALLRKNPTRTVIPISGERVPEQGIGWQEDWLIDAYSYSEPQRILSQEDILQGTHNRQNGAAVYAAAIFCGIEGPALVKQIKSFKGLEHRQENVLSCAYVTFVNDSKATNADSVMPALKRFHHVYWIAGGRPKEEGIASLTPFWRSIKKAFLIGEAADSFATLLQEASVPFEISHTLDRATHAAFAAARQEATATTPQIVLLSPACASFDQFKNFEERGIFFKRCVQKVTEAFHGVCAR
jgi:UDP-N-acetylmuramoylalanine--D-glutamate ligase